MRLIDADALKEYVKEQTNLPLPKNRLYMVVPVEDFITNLIDNQPTADAEPKRGTITLTYEEYGELCSYALADEQNHGEWLIDKSGSLMCSKCGTLLDEAQKPSRYCPNCGARMDEVEE